MIIIVMVHEYEHLIGAFACILSSSTRKLYWKKEVFRYNPVQIILEATKGCIDIIWESLLLPRPTLQMQVSHFWYWEFG